MMVALMWGLNIGALFPVLKVAFYKQSLQEWVVEEITDAKANVATYTTELETASPDRQSRLAVDIKNEKKAIKFIRLRGTARRADAERPVHHDRFDRTRLGRWHDRQRYLRFHQRHAGFTARTTHHV